jgi:uncharacterized BrkB/YihY/UPF0761 family membrane protein
MNKLTFYSIYLAISLGVTLWVGTTLRSSGRKFLRAAFDTEDMADTVNQLLQIGFYLANVGYIALVFRTYSPLPGVLEALEEGVPKLGGVLLILGLVHLFNMLILARMRRTVAGGAVAVPQSAKHTPAKVLEEAYHLRS